VRAAVAAAPACRRTRKPCRPGWRRVAARRAAVPWNAVRHVARPVVRAAVAAAPVCRRTRKPCRPAWRPAAARRAAVRRAAVRLSAARRHAAWLVSRAARHAAPVAAVRVWNRTLRPCRGPWPTSRTCAGHTRRLHPGDDRGPAEHIERVGRTRSIPSFVVAAFFHHDSLGRRRRHDCRRRGLATQPGRYLGLD